MEGNYQPGGFQSPAPRIQPPRGRPATVVGGEGWPFPTPFLGVYPKGPQGHTRTGPPGLNGAKRGRTGRSLCWFVAGWARPQLGQGPGEVGFGFWGGGPDKDWEKNPPLAPPPNGEFAKDASDTFSWPAMFFPPGVLNPGVPRLERHLWGPFPAELSPSPIFPTSSGVHPIFPQISIRGGCLFNS